MIASIDTTVNLCSELNTTFNQTMFLYLTYLDRMDLLYKYSEECSGFSLKELEDLEERGFVENHNKEGETYSDAYYVTEKFIKALINTDPDIAGEEFWDVYPSFITIDGVKSPLKNTDKSDFVRNYGAKVGKYYHEHQRVMRILRYGIDKNLVRMNIHKWFASEQYNEIDKHRKETNGLKQLPSQNLY